MTSVPPLPRPAATLLLLRESARGMEVLMVVRHHQIDFASGALVFPGGKLSPGDHDPRLRTRCIGADELPSEQLALRVGAIREAFEESGILLAKARGTETPVGVERAAELGPRYRKRLDAGEIGMLDLLEAEDLVLACDELVPFAHWITPNYQPKRFDNQKAMGPALHAMNANVPPEWWDQALQMYIPLGARHSQDDIANTVLFLVSDLAKSITGQTIHVDGGTSAVLGGIRWPYDGGRIMTPVPMGPTMAKLFG